MCDGFQDGERHVDDDAGDDRQFDWDDGNTYKLDDHRVSVAEAEEACLDPDRKVASAYNVGHERRRALVGATEAGRVLSVVYTVRSGRIRVISAYDATSAMRRKYLR